MVTINLFDQRNIVSEGFKNFIASSWRCKFFLVGSASCIFFSNFLKKNHKIERMGFPGLSMYFMKNYILRIFYCIYFLSAGV